MSDLCCCEYWDFEGERNHILACCCNCRDLDEGFEGLLTGRGVSSHNKTGVAKAFRDRMRIPWLGGAKQVTPDLALPVVLIPSVLLLASVNLAFTVISFVSFTIFMLIVYKYLTASMPKFFFMCTVVSVITLYLVFQFLVVSFLLILLEENVGASVLLFGLIICIYKTKLEVVKLRDLLLNSEKASDRMQYCQYCEVYTPEGSQHRFWIDSCITPANIKFYTIGLLFGLGALLYTSNLTLTSVCHPFTIYWTILLPDDCSDVYNMIELSLSFTSALYELLLTLFVFWELLFALKGICCGLRKSNQRSCFRGVLFNCVRTLCCVFNYCKCCGAQ